MYLTRDGRRSKKGRFASLPRRLLLLFFVPSLPAFAGLLITLLDKTGQIGDVLGRP